MADILVALVDLVHKLLDGDIALAGVDKALVKRLLQAFIGSLGLGQLFLERSHTRIGSRQLLFSLLETEVHLLVGLHHPQVALLTFF